MEVDGWLFTWKDLLNRVPKPEVGDAKVICARVSTTQPTSTNLQRHDSWCWAIGIALPPHTTWQRGAYQDACVKIKAAKHVFSGKRLLTTELSTSRGHAAC